MQVKWNNFRTRRFLTSLRMTKLRSCYLAFVLSCFCAILLSCYRAIVLSFFRSFVLSCHRAIVPSCYRAIVLSCHRAIVLFGADSNLEHQTLTFELYPLSFPYHLNKRTNLKQADLN